MDHPILLILMRYLHIGSVIVAVGGLLYSRFVLAPALVSAPAALLQGAVERFRPWLYAALGGIVVSGVYNYALKLSGPKLPSSYHMWIGIKMLLALHVLGVSFIVTKPALDEAKRNRLTFGIIVSAAVVVLISAYLRYISVFVVRP